MGGNKRSDPRLPHRLFVTDRFPKGRLNIYSKADLLAFIRHVLRDTEELQFIKDSCFGKLFDLPASQCPVSAQLIHSLLSRQLVVEDPHTLWTVFGSDPIRFGLKEFGTITGLSCGAFPVGYSPQWADQSNAHKDPDWIKLIGKKKFTTIADLRTKLETDKNMPGWKKLRLALIIIVDGVLIAHQQTPRPTLKYVKMVQDVETFCLHPWGRESFLKTITCMKPPKLDPIKCEDPLATLVGLLKQETLRLKGFPHALQLLAYWAIPKLLQMIPLPVGPYSIMGLDDDHLPAYLAPSRDEILRVEADPNLAVTSFIPIASQPQPGWGVWPDIYVDERVSYMEQLISDHHPFHKHIWPGGDTSEPIYTFNQSSPKCKQSATKAQKPRKSLSQAQEPRKSPIEALKPRKSSRKVSSSRNQRRMSSYYAPVGIARNSKDEVLKLLSEMSDRLSNIERESKQLRFLIKRRNSPSTMKKRSNLHSLLARSKKGHQSNRGC